MADHSDIEWCTSTWNPVVGCSILSPGCTNCYAMKMAARIEKMHPGTHYAGATKPSKAGPVWTGMLALAPARILTQPLRWKKPRTIFVNSMGDLFHEDVPDEWIDRVFAIMALCPQHTFQVLTKRSARMRGYLTSASFGMRIGGELMQAARGNVGAECAVIDITHRLTVGEKFLPNVWLGVSTERQQEAEERIPDLLATPAAIRFVSAEPLLGPIDFNDIPWPVDRPRFPAVDDISDGRSALRLVAGTRLDWIIVGGESGTDARPMHPDWARSIRNQCAASGVPFFFKQWGAYLPAGQLMADGRPWSPASGNSLHATKSLSGRFLDGVEHDGMPRP
jgi:protein gp37